MCDQSRYCGGAGLIGAEDLPEEHPERHQRRVDALVPAEMDFLYDLGNALRREDIREGESPVLKELLPQKLDLPRKPSMMNGSQGTGSLPVKGVGTPSSQPGGRISPIPLLEHLLRNNKCHSSIKPKRANMSGIRTSRPAKPKLKVRQIVDRDLRKVGSERSELAPLQSDRGEGDEVAPHSA